TAHVAVILIDARNGVVEQTRRHAYITSILRVPHITVAVNKMDLVEWSEDRFDEIVRELESLRAGSVGGKAADARPEEAGLSDLHVIPVSALTGDNVVEPTETMPWYDGPSLLEHLETLEIARDRNLDARRFPVQWVIRPMSVDHPDYRGYAGSVAGGIWRPGDEVLVLPSGLRSRVESIDTADGPLDEAFPPESVTIRLADDVDVARGDMLADPERPPAPGPCEARREAHEPRRSRRRRRARLGRRHPDARGHPVAGAPRAERHRRRAAAALGAARGRPVRRGPRDGRVHPDRRGDERHRRRRHGAVTG